MRTLAPSGAPVLGGAAVPRPQGSAHAQPGRRPSSARGSLARAGGSRSISVLGLRLPALGPAPRPRWPRVIVAVVMLYAGFMVVSDVARLTSLNHQIAAVDRRITALDAQDTQLTMQAAALQNPAAIADAARSWLGLAAPGDIVFTPVPPGH